MAVLAWATFQAGAQCSASAAVLPLEPHGAHPSGARGIKYGLQEHQLAFCPELCTRPVPVCWKPDWPTGPSFIHTVLPDITDNYQLKKTPFAPSVSQVSFLLPFQQYLAETC